MPKYNGHKNYNYWNVSLWIANDEGLYRLALDCIRESANRTEAAERFLDMVTDPQVGGKDTTPDGVKWTKSAIRAGMVELT